MKLTLKEKVEVAKLPRYFADVKYMSGDADHYETVREVFDSEEKLIRFWKAFYLLYPCTYAKGSTRNEELAKTVTKEIAEAWLGRDLTYEDEEWLREYGNNTYFYLLVDDWPTDARYGDGLVASLDSIKLGGFIDGVEEVYEILPEANDKVRVRLDYYNIDLDSKYGFPYRINYRPNIGLDEPIYPESVVFMTLKEYEELVSDLPFEEFDNGNNHPKGKMHLEVPSSWDSFEKDHRNGYHIFPFTRNISVLID